MMSNIDSHKSNLRNNGNFTEKLLSSKNIYNQKFVPIRMRGCLRMINDKTHDYIKIKNRIIGQSNALKYKERRRHLNKSDFQLLELTRFL